MGDFPERTEAGAIGGINGGVHVREAFAQLVLFPAVRSLEDGADVTLMKLRRQQNAGELPVVHFAHAALVADTNVAQMVEFDDVM